MNFSLRDFYFCFAIFSMGSIPEIYELLTILKKHPYACLFITKEMQGY